jgi:membrane protease YdiL (CAAX protease family)
MLKRPLLSFFLLTYLLSWTLWLAAAVFFGGTAPPNAFAQAMGGLLYIVGVFAPAIVALALTFRAGGRQGTQALLSGITRSAAPARLWVFAVVYMVAVKLLAALVHRVGTGTWPTFGTEPVYLMAIGVLFSTPVQAGEELGWRGYALPRLSARLGLPGAAVVLGVIWACWHLPFFFVAGTPQSGQSFPLYLTGVTALSAAMAWLYWRSQGSLLLVMLMHAAVNNTRGIVPATSPLIGWLSVAVMWIGAAYFLVRMRGAKLGLAAVLLLAVVQPGLVVAQVTSPVTLPSGYVDTSYTLPAGCEVIAVGSTPSGGCKTIAVNAGQSFQTALDTARRGDIIQLAANAAFTGPFELPDKGAGTGWVYVISSALGNLPGPGNRLSPDLGGTCGGEGALPCGVTSNASLADMPKILSGGAAPFRWLTTAHGADRYRFIGIEFRTAPGEFVSVGIRLYETLNFAFHATPAQKTSDIIFDRCLMRGQRTPPYGGRPIAINGDRHAVINSYLSDWVDDDADTQAVLVVGYARVFAVVNNYLEATGENVFTDGVETIDGVAHVPADGEIRGNYLRKLAAWNSKGWNNTKNQFEMKSGQRILFDGNVIDTTYRQAQETAINIKIGDEDPRLFVNNVTIRRNVVRHVANGIKVCATLCNSANNTRVITGVAVYNNIFDHVSDTAFGSGGDGHGFYFIVNGPSIFVDHNTFLNQNEAVLFMQRGAGVADGQTLVVTNNIWHTGSNSLPGSEVSATSSAAVYTNNLNVGGNCANYPAGNRCPATWASVGFNNYGNGNGGDYTLAASSPYKGVGSDPFGVGTTDPGANVAAVNAATACAVSGQCGETIRPTPIGAAAPRGDVRRVSWTGLTNASLLLWRLRKTGGCDDCADAGAVSAQQIGAGGGYVEVEVSDSRKAYFVGFGPGTPGTSPADLDFALRLNGTAADVYEDNTHEAGVPIADGDVLRISMSGGVVTYALNGSVFYTSRRTPVFPLFVRAVLLDRGAEIGRIIIGR